MLEEKTKFFAPGKCTVYVTFPHKPLRVDVYNDKGKIYFFRELGGKYNNIRFNICKKGHYSISEPCRVDKITDIEIPKFKVNLPAPDRGLMKSITIAYNPALKITPARITSKTGVIEIGPRFKAQPFPMKLFILCHEKGHLLYKSEENADSYALKTYLENGYNESNALYALTKILTVNENNKKRILKMFKQIHYES